MQVKLLRVLQEHCFQRVGSNKTQPVDVRIIAATHRDLDQHIEAEKFREDLFYRLNVFPIEMPSLRERRIDIPVLMHSMIKRLNLERGVFTLRDDTVQLLQQHSWPGNVRELSNLVERLRVLYRDQEVVPSDLPAQYQPDQTCAPNANSAPVSNEYIAADDASIELLQRCESIAQASAPVLICGETGTGKEALARHMHKNSSRKDEPFIIINTAMLQAQDIDRSLFGEEITRADGSTSIVKGKLEQAAAGTVLLDEILNMTPQLQARILRLLENGELERIGGTSTISIQARFIATSNGDVHSAVEAGKFRQDLYYRLNAFNLKITPLRDRPADIIAICESVLHNSHLDINALSADTLQQIQAHHWPGNVRELLNHLQQAITLAVDNRIEFSFPLQADNPLEPVTDGELNHGLRNHEQEMILNALRAGNGNRKYAAEKLGISPRTLRYKLAKLREAGITLPN